MNSIKNPAVKKMLRLKAFFLSLLLTLFTVLCGCSETATPQTSGQSGQILESQTYSSKDDVASYLHLYGHLPDNYITKQDAQKLGWESSKGNLWDVAPGKSIGGSRFGNYEGLLPESDSRQYYECDIDYNGGFRNEKRIVYSNDGLIYYTEDHYESFELLYGEES